MTTYLIISHSLVLHDAISNDVYLQHKLLKQEGYGAYMYSEFSDPWFSERIVNKAKLKKLLADPITTIIYHHSTHWRKGEEILDQAEGRALVKYHNITPSEFMSFDPNAQKDVVLGRIQTKKLVNHPKIVQWISDSEFNKQELIEAGANPDDQFVVAPFHKIPDFAKAKEKHGILKKIDKKKINLLFVSRIMPHKGQLNLLKMASRYIDLFGPEIHLHLVGKIYSKSYAEKMQDYIAKQNIGTIVTPYVFADFDTLYTLFRHCTGYISMSEHEGFGVPFLEAAYNALPTISLNRAAIKETIGDNQLLIDELDFDHFCAAIKTLQEASAHDFMSRKAYENYQRFSNTALERKFLSIIEERQ